MAVERKPNQTDLEYETDQIDLAQYHFDLHWAGEETYPSAYNSDKTKFLLQSSIARSLASIADTLGRAYIDGWG